MGAQERIQQGVVLYKITPFWFVRTRPVSYTHLPLIDTVGLVRRLPHHLVEAFKSTLEQAATADIILNICDASSPEAQVHLDVTRQILEELGCGARPVIPVLNKCDLVPQLSEDVYKRQSQARADAAPYLKDGGFTFERIQP